MILEALVPEPDDDVFFFDALPLVAAPASPSGVVSVVAGVAVVGAAAAAGAPPPTVMTCGVALLAGASSLPSPPIRTPTPSARIRRATPATAAAFVLMRASQPSGSRRVVVTVSAATATRGA